MCIRDRRHAARRLPRAARALRCHGRAREVVRDPRSGPGAARGALLVGVLPRPVRHAPGARDRPQRLEPGLSLIHISEPTRLLSISYAVFCLIIKMLTM